MTQRLNTEAFNRGLLDYLQASPSPFHATHNLAQALQAAGFSELKEGEAWSLQPGGRYFLTRNDSSIIAFHYGSEPLEETGIRMLGAHTDSPCLKLKPQPELKTQGYGQLGVEVYGGALLAPWFDRDLSLAGRVSYRDARGGLHNALVDFKTPLATVPSLAIHLDRNANNERNINAQKQMVPVVLALDEEQPNLDLRELLRRQLERQSPELDVQKLLDFEISLYDTQPPAQIGLKGDFIAAARLDNLLSCYVGLESLMEADPRYSALLVCNDHEEIGSASACGAKGPMLQDFLQRLVPEPVRRLRLLDKSLMISADNAHGVHPNFPDKHDDNHGPILNKGPVIKVNANQRYATNSETSALFRDLAERVEAPVQTFVSRADMECGSTIGSITAAELGVRTLDVGVPSFAMHSVRELAGSRDAHYLYRIAAAYFRSPRV